MELILKWADKMWKADTTKPLDLAIPLRSGNNNPAAFGIQEPVFSPFAAGDFIASVDKGSPVNCENLFINPHGNGTHTECIGHISPGRITINNCLKEFMFFAQVVTMPIREMGPNQKELLLADLPEVRHGIKALVVRTLPNNSSKLNAVYSSNFPAYLSVDLVKFLVGKGIEHLLVDLPSVDPEKDDGKMLAHKAFWDWDGRRRVEASISEMIYVDPEIEDGIYLLNLQIAALESDASPSKPVLYKLESMI